MYNFGNSSGIADMSYSQHSNRLSYHSPGLRTGLHSPQSSIPPPPPTAGTPTSYGPAAASPLARQYPVNQANAQVTSPSTMSYNPSEWTQQQMGFHRVVPQSTRNATGMEASMPSPPPPYSPEHPPNQVPRPSPLNDSYVASPVAETPSSNINSAFSQHMSPTSAISTQSPVSFPPPPGAQSSRQRERSASGNRLFSSITGLARGKSTAVQHETFSYQQQQPVQAELSRPPASKRAASTGHMPMSSQLPTQAHISARPQPGPSALPGPPPGPPPSDSRSQSLNRYGSATNSRSNSVEPSQTTARRAAKASQLGPVPPTPANWADGDPNPATPDNVYHDASEQPYQPLRIDTGAPREQSLTRRPATRDSSASGGLRERRSKSKATARDVAETPIEAHGDSVLSPVISPVATGSINQRREHTRKISTIGGQLDSNLRKDSPNHVMTPPYTPAVKNQAVPGSATSERHIIKDGPQSAKLPGNDSFYQQAIERHRAFIEKEANAANDEARLEAFANFLVHESRLRRDRYTAAYNSMAGEIVDMTRDMWRSYQQTGRRAATPTSTTSESHPRQALSINTEQQSSSSGDYTPATDSGSADGEGGRQWGEVFKPSLSPIPSMAVSTVPDENDSRGRAPSRWWEKSEASGSIGKPERIEKSYRETKYMGVNPALLRSSPQNSPDLLRRTPTAGASNMVLGPNEYPPEKVSWYDDGDYSTPVSTPSYVDRTRKMSGSEVSDRIDISRLVTLPPPYPRHHPAINNSHPSLANLRNVYRSLAINEDVQRIRDAYIDSDWAMRKRQAEEAKQRRIKMRKSVQDQVNDGELSFADAAKAEANFEVDETERGKANARALFDAFESAVSHPLNTLVTERLATAEKSMEDLRKDLEKTNVSTDPNRAQEEGDEHPERLEKLTLLKWMFEAREVLHKEMFDLHAQRSEKYGEVVLTPYRIAKQQNKIDEAEAFFKKDGRQRLIAYNKESLKRYEAFLAVVETNVTSGVEDQLSAFWDIAPGLKEVIQHLPIVTADDRVDMVLLGRLQLFVPPQEVEENPAYSRFPLQYLYSVLSHAQKSAYQFIESQTNLLCLLHEVRELTAEAGLRVIQTEQSDNPIAEGENLNGENQQAKDLEGKRLTAELKEKVGEVERQWEEALGERIGSVKTGVRTWLDQAGGWEDGLDG